MMLLLQLQNSNAYFQNLEKMISYLTKKMKKGYFGSTQATILSLLAFDLYFSEFVTNQTERVSFNVNINQIFSGNLLVEGEDLLQANNCIDLSERFKQFETAGQDVEISITPIQNQFS